MSVFYCEKTRTFYLNGKNISYVMQVNFENYVEHLYYGKSIACDDLSYTMHEYGCHSAMNSLPGKDNTSGYHNFQPELSFYGTGDFREPTVEVLNPNGDRLTELLYDSHEILTEKPPINGMPSLSGGETLVLHLKDKVTGFCADLYYTVYDDAPVVARRIVYKNCSDSVIRLNRAYSFVLPIPETKYEAMTLHGGWAKERTPERTPLHHGVFSIDSKRTSSSAAINPFMAVMTSGATESSGEVYGVSLVYSSSYVLKAVMDADSRVYLTGGINDFDFSWKLEVGEILETPEVVLAYSANGIGDMSRAYHDAFREHIINKRFVKAARPIVINNWEGTYFDFNGEKLKRIADGVVGTGVDTFVLDDGWFGKRNDESTGLGDWYVNEKKMGESLDSVIAYINSLGMKFGLWFEPEMISEDSDIFRAHPEYAIGAANRPRTYARHQYVMDITRPEVRDYIVNSLNSLLKKHNIEYVKWDYNRYVTESWSLGREADRQSEFAHRYALGLYELCERIIEANPTVFFEGCASGGARFDPAMLHYFPQIWTSDDTDAEERTRIQYGTSMVYPLSAMSCHISDIPNHQTGRKISMATRATVAHLGATGYELDASKFTDEDRIRVKSEVEEYKVSADLILNGDFYRIDSPFETNRFTVCIASKDKEYAELIAYRRIGSVNNEIVRIKAAGLDPEKRYYVKELEKELCGSTLMNVGWTPKYPGGDFTCIKYHIKAVK